MEDKKIMPNVDDLEYKVGDVFTITGDNVEYEVVSAVVPENLGFEHYVIAPKFRLDEQRGGPANEQQPNQEGDQNA